MDCKGLKVVVNKKRCNVKHNHKWKTIYNYGYNFIHKTKQKSNIGQHSTLLKARNITISTLNI